METFSEVSVKSSLFKCLKSATHSRKINVFKLEAIVWHWNCGCVDLPHADWNCGRRLALHWMGVFVEL